jgi:hypothetical protein
MKGIYTTDIPSTRIQMRYYTSYTLHTLKRIGILQVHLVPVKSNFHFFEDWI